MSRPCRVQALALVNCLAAAQAQASLMIRPLDPVTEEDQRAAALWLENRGQQPRSLQIRVLAWSQADRTDGYASQETVIASPPMAVVPPASASWCGS